jgi:hypothetical protein
LGAENRDEAMMRERRKLVGEIGVNGRSVAMKVSAARERGMRALRERG